MIFVVLFVYLVHVLVKSDPIIKKRKVFFNLAIIFSIFFFNSADIIVGLPLYMYPMILSVLLSLICKIKIKKNALIILISLITSMFVPLVAMGFGMLDESYLLLKDSNADAINIYNQLFIPKLDFTVFKHFIFFILYLLFVMVNYDLLNDNQIVKETVNIIEIVFKILFIALAIEWIIVNITGFNDRPLMQLIFSLKTLNQTSNWYTWGSKSVALCFSERSAMSIILIYYAIVIQKKMLSKKDYLYIILSIIAIYCTGSSTALAAMGLFMLLFFVKVAVENRKLGHLLIVLIIGIIVLTIFVLNFQLFTQKIYTFLFGGSDFGSAFSRSRSIELGITAIQNHPLFGVGIGTIYAHSLIVQSTANIGIIGMLLTLALHRSCCNINLNFKNALIMIYITIILFSASNIQHFTSPYFLMIIIVLRMGNVKQNIAIEKPVPRKEKYEKNINYNDNI